MTTERVLEGRSIVAGCASGRLVILDVESHATFRVTLEPEQIPAEIERLKGAVAKAQGELDQTRDAVPVEVGDELSPIFEAQSLLLNDEALRGRIEGRIESERVNAEWAVAETLRALAKTFAQFDTSHLRERADDLRDIGRALIRALSDDPFEPTRPLSFDDPVILVSGDLTPSEAIRLSRAGVVGFALDRGGQTSHTAIIARALNLPLVAGIGEPEHLGAEGCEAIVDGDRGLLIVDPAASTLARYRDQAADHARRDDLLAREAGDSAKTTDNHEVRLMANIDLAEELADARRFGSEGIGLYRSEFLFIEKSPTLPTEEEQLTILREMLTASAPHPLVIRTFDLGGRKLAREVIETEEENPVLGLRGIRLTLQRRDVFRSQVRAILRAGVFGRVRVLLPMVTAVEEIRQFRDFVAEAADELEREGIEHRRDFRLGAMIEVPSAALIADRLAREVDFFSLGTNDLVQYSLAVDRNNEHVAYLYQPFHPAILRMVRFVVDSAQAAGIGVVLCGEVAADPHATALLLGLGLRRFSITPRAIPAVKQRVRELSMQPLAEVAERCLEAASAGEVEAILESAGLNGKTEDGQHAQDG